jgi:SAM-dependent methyltransferase
VTGGTTPLDYAAWRESTLGRITERLERAVVLDLTGSLDGLDVLDVGTGDGAYALALARRGARVTGLDASLSALRAAAGRARDSGLRLALVAADVHRMPFHEGTFDLVIAVTALCFVRSPHQAMCEIARVLRPGGRLVLGELGRWSAWAASRRIRGLLGASTWRQAIFRTAPELRRLAKEAGSSPNGCGERSSTRRSPPRPLRSRRSIPSSGGRPHSERRSSPWKQRSRRVIDRPLVA